LPLLSRARDVVGGKEGGTSLIAPKLIAPPIRLPIRQLSPPLSTITRIGRRIATPYRTTPLTQLAMMRRSALAGRDIAVNETGWGPTP
jgi:hypothetical protein